jgi:Uma2 family endonuclease
MPPSSTARSTHRNDDRVVVLHGVTWAEYMRRLEARGESAVPRLSFLEGELEIMAPSELHETIKSMIGRLVEAWCMERGIDVTPVGSWTLKEKRVARGLEPDECYVVGEYPKNPRRPHLAIEVDRKAGGLRKLEIYRRLAVREVWTWRDGAITVSVLRQRRYVTVPESEVLPGIDLAQLLQFVDERPMARAVRSYLRALRAR